MHEQRTAPQNLAQGLDGYIAVVARLHSFGVSVDHAALPDDDAIWEPHTATIYLRVDAPLSYHIRDLSDFWLSLVFPDHVGQFQPAPRQLYALP